MRIFLVMLLALFCAPMASVRGQLGPAPNFKFLKVDEKAEHDPRILRELRSWTITPNLSEERGRS